MSTRWFLFLVLLLVAVCYVSDLQANYIPVKYRDYGLKVGAFFWLGKNQNISLMVDVNDDGWGGVSLRVDPSKFYYKAERINQTSEMVEKGFSVLTTPCETVRVVQVYSKKTHRLVSTHRITMTPH